MGACSILDGGYGIRQLENLSWIHKPLGVDDVLDLLHELVALAVLELHELALPDAYPVFACAGATYLDGLLDDGLVDGLKIGPFRLVLRIAHHDYVQVAVAGVAKYVTDGLVIVQRLLGKQHDLGVARNGNRCASTMRVSFPGWARWIVPTPRGGHATALCAGPPR